MSDYYEFGPFRLDVSTRSLYRSDQFIQVTPKVIETLLILVENAGRVVTKEELLQRIWPHADVEEGSITNNVSTLRKILNPHFEGDGPIATVPRRGYRFTASVRFRSRHAEGHTASDPPRILRISTVTPAVPSRLSPRWYAMAAVIVGVAALATALLWKPATGATAASVIVRRSVALLPLKNLSGAENAWFTRALAETLNREIGAAGQLRLISGENIAAMPKDLAPPGVTLNRKQLNEIGRTLGCDLVLTGTYHAAGGRLIVDVRLDDIASAKPVASLRLEEDEHKLLDLVATVSRELHEELGLSRTPLGPGETVGAGFSSNPNALRFYFLGFDALRSHAAGRSRELLAQAIAEDPNFALAHSALSTAYRIMGDDARAQEEARRAFELSKFLVREDQLLVEGAYYEVTSNWSKAIEKYQALWNFFPDNVAYGVRLIYQLMKGGQLDEAQRVLDQLRALPPPTDADPGINLVATLLATRFGNFADALAEASGMAAKATARNANNQLAAARSLQGNAAQQLGNSDQARRHYADAAQIYERLGDSAGVAATMNMDAMVLISRDQLDGAERLVNTADEIAKRLNFHRLAAEIRFSRATVKRQQGHLESASAEADAAIAAARAVDDRSQVARGLNLRGSVLTLQGGFDGARASFEESVTIARGIGEKAVFTAAVNGLAGIDLMQGRMAAARQRLEEIIPIDRRTGDRSALALRLSSLSAALGMQGHLAEAEAIAAEECAIHESLAAMTALAGCRVRLAELWLDQQRTADVRAAFDRIATQRAAVSLPPIDLARLAGLYLRTGDAKRAAATIAEARRGRKGRTSSPEQVIGIAIMAARIDAASGQVADARRQLAQARSEAERLGLLPLALEARLGMCERGAPPAARAEAAAIERDAAREGLAMIAGRARAIGSAERPDH